MEIFDTLALDASPRRTGDGYLIATARVARTGIQEYSGRDAGRPDMDTVRVYRPPEEVFHKDALVTFAHKPITNDHPPVSVDSKNWKRYAVGKIGEEVARDGDTIRVPLILMDENTILDVEAGKAELSMGYTTDLKWEAGVTPDGLQYDAKQTNIRANHLAVVDKARGGPRLRIGDDDMPEIKTRTVLVDGIPVESTEAGATVIESLSRKLADSTALATKAQADLAALQASSTASVAAKDAELVTIKAQLTDATSPAKIAEAIRVRSAIIGKAKTVLGDKLGDVTLKSDHEIRKMVVDGSAIPAEVRSSFTEDQVRVAFETLTANVKAADIADPLRDAISRGATVTNLTDTRKALQAADEASRNAWKGQPAAAG